MLVSDRVYYVHAGLCAHMCIHISGHHGVEFSSIRAPMCQGRQFLRLSCACTRIIWTYEFICPGASEATHIRVPHTCLGVSGDTQMFMNMYACTPEWGNMLVPERVSVNTHIHASKRTQLWKVHMSYVQM